jgi:Rad3-related DNA helicase
MLPIPAGSDSDCAEILGSDGPLAEHIPGFAARRAQQEMARWVATALADLSALVVEAGTGTGKTYAYLVPALLSGRHVIISTGTRTLQDQLFHRDLPAVAAALGRPVNVAVLKGRSNYLCRHRLDLATRGLTLDLGGAGRNVLESRQRMPGVQSLPPDRGAPGRSGRRRRDREPSPAIRGPGTERRGIR